MIFEGIGFEEEWWLSVFLFNGKQIVFQVYNDTQDIEDRSVFCFDIQAEEVLWSIDGVKLQQVNPTTIRCTGVHGEEQEPFLIDVATGNTLDELTEDGLAPSSPLFPLMYDTDNSYHTMLVEFLGQRGVSGVVGGIEYLEYNDLVIFGINVEEENTYSLKLFVYDAAGTLLLDLDLEKGLSGRASGAFFILDQALIFVMEKRRLKICSIA